jgi:MbtH protein
MANPFEDDTGEYLVLVNEEEQYSLWPSFVEIPSGWTVTGPKGKRSICLEWIDNNWTDMRPKSLILAMKQQDEASHNEK